VVVCDGFVGNVVLKLTEGLVSTMFGLLKEQFSRTWTTKLGAAMVMPGLKELKRQLDYTEYGGAPLLGVNGVSIICHGSSQAKAIRHALRAARECVASDFVRKMANRFPKICLQERKQRMTNNNLRSVGIIGTGSYAPEQVITNQDLAKFVDTSDEWIVSRSGIRERRIAAVDEATSDLCAKAAERALNAAGITAADIDLIIVATATPDMQFPSTACLVQEKLQAWPAAAFDLGAGCTGFVYAVSVASQFIATGMYSTILVVGGETLSRILNWQDRNTCVLFGDGAGAAVLRPVEAGRGILAIDLGADGRGGVLLKQPAGGTRMPATLETVEANLHTLQMQGKELFKHAVRAMGDSAAACLAKAGVTTAELDWCIPHQANKRIIDATVKRLDLPADKVYINLDRYGNVSAASIPIALDEMVSLGKIKQGNLALLVAFGTGLTWGSIVLRW
jgi:3-oxoacyl-[acyl-carrier-protein] synthase-3